MLAYQIFEVVGDFFVLAVACFEHYQYTEKSLYQAIYVSFNKPILFKKYFYLVVSRASLEVFFISSRPSTVILVTIVENFGLSTSDLK